MRKRRLARLGGTDSNGATVNSNGANSLNSPSTSGPSSALSGFGTVPTTQNQPHQLQPSQQKSIQSDTPMDTEESSEKQSNNSGIDVDSGIENMEVEEPDRKDVAPRSRVCKNENKNLESSI